MFVNGHHSALSRILYCHILTICYKCVIYKKKQLGGLIMFNNKSELMCFTKYINILIANYSLPSRSHTKDNKGKYPSERFPQVALNHGCNNYREKESAVREIRTAVIY